jgi:two-component system, NtrC family, nitrogen regulation sensor histidine kinase GlnL
MNRATVPSLTAIIEALPNPLLVLDANNTVCQANAAAEDFFQVSTNLLCKLGVADLVPFSSPLLQAVEQVRRSGNVVIEYGMSIGTPRYGGERSVDIQTAPVGDGTGFVMLQLLRRSMAQKLGQQLSHLGAARSVSAMAAMLAHEIKNPLAGIKGAAQLIEPGLTEQDRGLARLIQDEAERIRKLVDQMEVFTDERPLHREPVNIHVVLDRVKKLVSAEANSVSFVEEYDPSLPFVFGNMDQLVQVFLNLARNAIDAVSTVGGPREVVFSTAFRPGIKLQVAGSSERISLPLEISVHDNGTGVPDELFPHIFDAFVTTKPQGRGLGLALVAKVIKDHGGTVECLPRRQGTTFRCLLPMIKPDEDQVASGGRTEQS